MSSSDKDSDFDLYIDPNPVGSVAPGESYNMGTPLMSEAPYSPKNKVLHFLGRPVRFINRKFAPGSMKGSVFTTMASTLGIGILNMPYAINLAGLYLGIFWLLYGLVLAIYSTRLLIVCADAMKDNTYEGIAFKAYGRRMKIFSEINMII